MPRTKGAVQKIKEHPEISVNRKTIQNYSPKKVCACCGKQLASTRFYKSLNPLASDHLSDFCKDCLLNFVLDENGNVDSEKLRTICQQLNRAFIPDVLEAATNEFASKYLLSDVEGKPINQAPIVQLYMKNIASLPQYSRLSYEQGIQYVAIQEAKTNVKAADVPSMEETHKKRKTKEKQEERIYTSLNDEEDDVSPETIARFGEGFTRFQYKQFEKKYKFLSQSYGNYSALHEEALIQYVRYRVLEEESVSNNDIESAEKFGNLANKAAAAAKINPSQIKDTDDGGGFSFSEFNAAIERASDVIRILPRFKETALDSPDICLYTYIQYMCAMLGKPLVEYKDIYKFYDDSVENYIETTGDPYKVFTKKNREAVKKNRTAIEKFLDVPKSNQASYFNGDDK